ncbi:hypothetical protein ACPXAZ_25345, partial [Escherichia coli]|uniref:hypothetical protein n=1 Tax=Escherichia coli TaxID=562 RepID=UPI003CE4A1A2
MTRIARFLALAVGVLATGLPAASHAQAQALPDIRTSPDNRVPACVTPQSLMAFVAERNTNLLPKYSGIADAYREIGESYGVRWD